MEIGQIRGWGQREKTSPRARQGDSVDDLRETAHLSRQTSGLKRTAQEASREGGER